MQLRSLTILAMLAALVGAPPSASAATNLLHAPSATPTAGTAETSFRLHVEYRGTFPAASVEADLAAVSVPMTLADDPIIASLSLDENEPPPRTPGRLPAPDDERD